jgi:hypothetical protein
MRAVVGLRREDPPELTCRIYGGLLSVKSDRPIWGPQPFLALRTRSGTYYHDNFIIDSETEWKYAFDEHSVRPADIASIGIATNDRVGNTVVLRCGMDRPNDWSVKYLNTEDWIEEKICETTDTGI